MGPRSGFPSLTKHQLSCSIRRYKLLTDLILDGRKFAWPRICRARRIWSIPDAWRSDYSWRICENISPVDTYQTLHLVSWNPPKSEISVIKRYRQYCMLKYSRSPYFKNRLFVEHAPVSSQNRPFLNIISSQFSCNWRIDKDIWAHHRSSHLGWCIRWFLTAL